jgi:type II secretion system protein C
MPAISTSKKHRCSGCNVVELTLDLFLAGEARPIVRMDNDVMKSARKVHDSRNRRWLYRLISVGGAFAIAALITWETGLDPLKLWQGAMAPKPVPISKAPAIPPMKAIGITPTVPKGNDSSISREPLSLMLVRVHLGRNATEGSAEMGVVLESPQTYQAGAMLENGARLAEIHADYVLLTRGTNSARLYLRNGTAGKVGDIAMLTVGGVKEAPPPAKVTSREILTDYIRPTPVYDQETIVGYQVYPGTQSGPFAQMGLQPGDLITEIDGTPLNDPQIAWDIFHQLAEGSALSATVKRHGAFESVTLEGSIIRAEEARSQQATQAMLVPPGP